MFSEKYRKIQTAILLLVVFVLTGISVPGCKKKQKEEIPPRPVSIAESVQKDATIYIDSFGTMITPQDVDIKSQVTGEVKETYFTEGSDVSEGDLLVLIDPSQYKAALEKAEAALASDMAELKLKTETLERNRPLIEKNLISQQEFDGYLTDFESAEAQVLLDKAEVKLRAIDLERCYIRAHMDGITGRELVNPGNIVAADNGPALLNLKMIDPLYVYFTVSERDLARVRKAKSEGTLEVYITVENDNKKYEGELDFLDNTVDDTTGTVMLRAVVQNAGRALWPGQFVNVRLILGTEKNKVLVPYQAVQLGQKGPYLFTVTSDNKADLREVTTGERQDDYIVIEKGVKAGERVVTVGQIGLRPGIPVVDTSKQKEQSGAAKKTKKKK